MLAQERYAAIMDFLQAGKSVTLQELMEALHASESTIRRDLKTLEKSGRLLRVHGGAVLKSASVVLGEEMMDQKRGSHADEKRRIGKKAASLIQNNDFVYIDAGTSTEAMLEYIEPQEIKVVTNAISHAKALAERGFDVSIPGGQFKAVTEAIVGTEAVDFLSKYNFTIGFFGTNGIDENGTLTTPDVTEAMVKKKAMEQCARRYVLADSSKFNQKSLVNFGSLQDSTVITCPVLSKESYPEDHCILV